MGKDHFYFGTNASAAAVWKERQCFVLCLVVPSSAGCHLMPSLFSSLSAKWCPALFKKMISPVISLENSFCHENGYLLTLGVVLLYMKDLFLSFKFWNSSSFLCSPSPISHSMFLKIFLYVLSMKCIRGTAVAQWLRCCATNRKVAGSIPAGVIGIFHWHCGPGVDSVSNRNEYQEHFLGVKAAGA